MAYLAAPTLDLTENQGTPARFQVPVPSRQVIEPGENCIVEPHPGFKLVPCGHLLHRPTLLTALRRFLTGRI